MTGRLALGVLLGLRFRDRFQNAGDALLLRSRRPG